LFYSSAPERNNISVIIVSINETAMEKINVSTLRSNHHQNATHRNAKVKVKWRSLWNGIFYNNKQKTRRYSIFVSFENTYST